MTENKINLQGEPIADLTINCDSETFRVHKYFLCSKSPVFSAMLNSDMREAREGEINIRDMNSDTVSSMIHYIYTGELADGWQDLDLDTKEMAEAADMYDLPGWMKLILGHLAKEFLQHCHDNNLDGVRESLSRGADVNTVSEDGHWSGLTIAAVWNYPELLEILLSHPDIKINNTTKTCYGTQWTALIFACNSGHSAIVSRLVEVPGLDINYQDENGETAAHWASMIGMVGHTECVRILAETGRVDWNKRDNSYSKPLHCALEGGHSDIVDIIKQQPDYVQ